MGSRLHIVHIVFRFDYGGLENGLVNVINTMSPEFARHTVISLTEVTDIAQRLRAPDTRVIALEKRPGKDLMSYYRLYRVLRKLGPDVVHTRNFGTLDCQLVAWLAGVPLRIHGEHGWDIHDPDGTNPRYRRMRRWLFPLVHRVVALSKELEDWLQRTAVVPSEKVVRICNGVDCSRFQSNAAAEQRGGREGGVCFGSVTRFSAIKDPLNVLRAFNELRKLRPEATSRIRLLMVGGGALLDEAHRYIEQHELSGCITLVGEQLDVAPWLRRMDVFVLGSKREGISNTVLEAMAQGLPVIASNVGGNPELIEDGATGALVPPENSLQLAHAMAQYVDDPGLAVTHGRRARRRAESQFSLEVMTDAYTSLYASLAPVEGAVSA